MKRYIVVLITLAVLALALMYYHKYKIDHTKKVFPKSKLLKETWVWLYDSACYREQGTYLRIYRKYNYSYTDTVMKGGHISDYTNLYYAVTYRGDTVYMEYTDLTYYPHR